MARPMTKRPSAKQMTTNAKVDCTALYIRVSTDAQANEGYSLEAQRDRLNSYCKSQQWSVCENHIYIDAGISGTSTTGRAALAGMMEAARRGEIDRIVAVKLDRLARNVRDFLEIVTELKKVGCAIALLDENFDTSTPTGEFALTMFAAMAQLEASVITERVMNGKRQKAKEGGYNGAPAPLGYNYADGRFTPNDDAGTVERIYTEFVEGATLTAIAQGLNRDEVKTAKGGKWYPSTVKYVLLNGIYAGIAQWNPDKAKDEAIEAESDAITPIIRRGVYDAAHARLEALKPGPG